MSRKNEIILKSVGIDYEKFSQGRMAFDYEAMMENAAYSLDEVGEIQRAVGVGNTPLLELKNLTQMARDTAPRGYGARIFVKDEAANPSGSFKARRAAVSVYHAKKNGFTGVLAATSGNYGAAVASQAAMQGLNCIIVQEVYDSKGVGQPEIVEKGRKCEALGAEVVQLTVGPELFYTALLLLEETGYFNASLYTPFGIAGIETLGSEIAGQVQQRCGRPPDAVVVTHAGGGNVTGTARGLIKAGCASTRIIGASVDLTGLHMASDRDFNRKSFTTGHTGFGVPFATWPDRTDVPRNAARPLRYLDRYVLITQGEVFYMTEALAQLEGIERGPAGNTSLAAAVVIAREMKEDEILVVQETEYTGAGKHPSPQLTFAVQSGVEVKLGDPAEDVPGKVIAIPRCPEQLRVREFDLKEAGCSYLRNAVRHFRLDDVSRAEMEFLASDIRWDVGDVRRVLTELGVSCPNL